MPHTRLRKFNTKDTYPEQKLDNDLCQAVVARGTMVFLRGQVGQDLETRESIGGPTLQAEKAMSNIKMLLEEVGGKLEDICKITIYITDPRYRGPVTIGPGAPAFGSAEKLGQQPDTPAAAMPGPDGVGGVYPKASSYSAFNSGGKFPVFPRKFPVRQK